MMSMRLLKARVFFLLAVVGAAFATLTVAAFMLAWLFIVVPLPPGVARARDEHSSIGRKEVCFSVATEEKEREVVRFYEAWAEQHGWQPFDGVFRPGDQGRWIVVHSIGKRGLLECFRFWVREWSKARGWFVFTLVFYQKPYPVHPDEKRPVRCCAAILFEPPRSSRAVEMTRSGNIQP